MKKVLETLSQMEINHDSNTNEGPKQMRSFSKINKHKYVNCRMNIIIRNCDILTKTAIKPVIICNS